MFVRFHRDQNSIFLSEKRLEFEKRRKAHYNEFEAIKLARKLIEEDEEDDDDANEGETSKSAANAHESNSS